MKIIAQRITSQLTRILLQINLFTSLNLSPEARLEILGPMFQCNYETIKDQSVDQWVSNDIKVIDFLANNTIKELDNPNYFDIDALLCTSAITAKE